MLHFYILEPIKILIVKRSPQYCFCVKVEISKFRHAINLQESDKLLLYKSTELTAVVLGCLCTASMEHGWL